MKFAPVMNPARLPSSRNATISAMSCGQPTRPTGCCSWSLRRHDGALRGTQRPLSRAGQQEGGGQVGVEDLAPFGQGEQAQRLAHYDAGVRYQRVEAIEFVGDGFDRATDGFFIRNVALDQNGVAPIPVVAALEPRSRQIDHADAPSGLQQLT